MSRRGFFQALPLSTLLVRRAPADASVVAVLAEGVDSVEDAGPGAEAAGAGVEV